jgi:hypothetical protein
VAAWASCATALELLKAVQITKETPAAKPAQAGVRRSEQNISKCYQAK